ncbi:MAG: tRNA (cytidine(34)-2'-O)-methyltransferase [Candidatus Izemoplasmatales bacterium]|nr:tRNA (cytidine(34)-2'-O)-methyltransferase [Candidatus Izemoplasmatales bacterium]MDD3864774.1 tRNA (cytidine(34)-2'-O)-methyltransferase [Candidatus Izemoplasmatales bacterium]
MLNVVLYAPEIPQNTGNIMRTCAGTNTLLHLIEPLGFKLDPKYLKRSGVNYLEYVNYRVYKTWDEFKANNPGLYIFATRYGRKSPDMIDFSMPDVNYYLIFGKESTGIPKSILRGYLDTCVRLPMNDKIRSLNLSNCVCAILYEALRQRNYDNLYRFEPTTLKGPDWINTDE